MDQPKYGAYTRRVRHPIMTDTGRQRQGPLRHAQGDEPNDLSHFDPQIKDENGCKQAKTLKTAAGKSAGKPQPVKQTEEPEQTQGERLGLVV